VKKTLAYAARDYTYGGVQLDRGQVFEMKGLKNDAGLLRNDLAVLLEEDGISEDELLECGECGAKFISPGHLDPHGDLRHGNR
jgi:hypothetical protein